MIEKEDSKTQIWKHLKAILAIIMLFVELVTGYFSLISPYTSIIDSLVFFVYAAFTYGYLNMVLSEIRESKNIPWYLKSIEKKISKA